MSNPIPNQVGLITIADDAEIIASDHRNNYSDIQTLANALVVALTSGEYDGALLYAPDSSHLAFLPDTPADGDALIWNATDSRWEPGSASGGGATIYRKTTAKAVNTTTVATDLLNGEITLAANVLGTEGWLKATLIGNILQNVGSSETGVRFQLVVGGTTIFDTGVLTTMTSNTVRLTWRMNIECLALGATGSQLWHIEGYLNRPNNVSGWIGTNNGAFTTGTGGWMNDTGQDPMFLMGETTSTLDDTAALPFVFNVINGVSNANYETRLLGAVVEII